MASHGAWGQLLQWPCHPTCSSQPWRVSPEHTWHVTHRMCSTDGVSLADSHGTGTPALGSLLACWTGGHTVEG